MRAFELRQYGGPGGLALSDDVVPPRPSEDEVLVAVEAVGINFPDLLMTKGLYQVRPELPFVPGCEVAGTVEQAPSESGLRPGDRVAGFTWSGGYAERATVPLRSIAAIPPGLTPVQAAAIVVNYNTALFALQRRGRLEGGDQVLVMGAAGGIGTASIQIAKGLGAYVVAGVADEAQCEVALRAGADRAVVLMDGFAASVRAVLPDARGVDVVVDPLGDWLFGESLRTLGPEGRVVVLGFAAGEIPSITVNRLLHRNATVVGAGFGAFLDTDATLMGRQAETLGSLVAAGHVRPEIEGTYDFAELPDLLDRLDRGVIVGKAVVTF